MLSMSAIRSTADDPVGMKLIADVAQYNGSGRHDAGWQIDRSILPLRDPRHCRLACAACPVEKSLILAEALGRYTGDLELKQHPGKFGEIEIQLW
jgi:hypothetical protein